MYSWIAQCREPSIIFELLRLIVMMDESKIRHKEEIYVTIMMMIIIIIIL